MHRDLGETTEAYCIIGLIAYDETFCVCSIYLVHVLYTQKTMPGRAVTFDCASISRARYQFNIFINNNPVKIQ